MGSLPNAPAFFNLKKSASEQEPTSCLLKGKTLRELQYQNNEVIHVQPIPPPENWEAMLVSSPDISEDELEEKFGTVEAPMETCPLKIMDDEDSEIQFGPIEKEDDKLENTLPINEESKSPESCTVSSAKVQDYLNLLSTPEPPTTSETVTLFASPRTYAGTRSMAAEYNGQIWKRVVLSSSTCSESAPRPRSPTPPPEAPPIGPVFRENSQPDEGIDLTSNSGSTLITLRRETFLLNDMLDAFKDADILENEITFVFKDEKGVDVDGLSREAYSLFWDKFLLMHSMGDGNEKIPCLRPEFGKGEWQALARILYKGYKTSNVWPLNLNAVFATCLFFGEGEITDDKLIQGLMNYVAEDDKELLQLMMNDEDIDEDDKMDLLHRMGCGGEFGDGLTRVKKIAHKLLIQVSRWAVEAMSEVLQDYPVPFDSVDEIYTIYSAKEPTCRKVLKLIKADPPPQNVNERDVFEFLKSFIRGLSKEDLGSFLQFTTGCSQLSVPEITVTFFTVKPGSIDEHPIARTCGCVLQLPSTYRDCPTFKSQFLNILRGHDGKYTFA